MKIISVLFIVSLSFIGLFDSASEDRLEMINSIVEEEREFGTAHCFCRIGDDRGARLKDYPNALKDLGKLKKYTGLTPVSNKTEDDCGRICAIKAADWLNSLSTDQICSFVKKPTVRILAYSKVGGRDWTARGAGKQATCCNSGGTLTCPPGSNSENNNFPGYCSVSLCAPSVKGDRRLYSENGSVWGFIYQDQMYQLVKGRLSGAGWRACN